MPMLLCNEKILFEKYNLMMNYNILKKNKEDLSSALYTLGLSLLILNTQCYEGARYAIFVLF